MVGVMRCVIVAALPCVAVAIYNAGYQARSAVAAGLAAPGDWRSRALEALGAPATSTHPGACIAHGLAILLPLFLAALLAGGLAERLFAHFRQRTVDHTTLGVTALLFTLCLPPSLALWQAALGGFVAVAVGKEIFGGFGRNFVNPALVGFGFLYFAYPGALSGDAVWVAADGYSGATPLGSAHRGGLAAIEASGWTWPEALWGRVPGGLGETSAAACVLGLAMLLYTGVASWRIVAGGALGLIGMALLTSALASRPIADLPWHWHAVTGSFAFGMVFLATDPVTAPVTNPARWLYGLAIGALVVLLRVANPAHRESVLLAIVLGNVMAPLLDQIVARIMMRRRPGFDAR
ncbi:MAG: NADH:ubiquinone reductase (Na(+)-transporting) subunit B [Myxococcales bacterium]|nr:NADH:ubiquinone reductase (Na(+)-transporting) subunit B [Myxococcales bacterium]